MLLLYILRLNFVDRFVIRFANSCNPSNCQKKVQWRWQHRYNRVRADSTAEQIIGISVAHEKCKDYSCSLVTSFSSKFVPRKSE